MRGRESGRRTFAPTRTAPRNSQIPAAMQACRRVRDLEETEVANELATSAATSKRKGQLGRKEWAEGEIGGKDGPFAPMLYASSAQKMVPIPNRKLEYAFAILKVLVRDRRKKEEGKVGVGVSPLPCPNSRAHKSSSSCSNMGELGGTRTCRAGRVGVLRALEGSRRGGRGEHADLVEPRDPEAAGLVFPPGVELAWSALFARETDKQSQEDARSQGANVRRGRAESSRRVSQGVSS